MNINNKPTETTITISPSTTNPYDTNVSIFNSTPAREIPSRINAIATSLKGYINGIFIDKTTYLNTSISSLVTKVNSLATNLVDYVNTEIVVKLNSFQTEVLTDNSNFQTAILTDNSNFQTEVLTNLGTLIGVGAGYNISQINDLLSDDISYTTDKITNRIVSITTRDSVYDNFIYDKNSNIINYTVTLTKGGATFTQNYKVTKNEVIKL